MPELDPRPELGRRAEAAVARALRWRGYRIVDRNWRCRLGEIDIVARQGGDLVVIEVRARSSTEFGEPELTVGGAKQRKLSRLLEAYVHQHHLEDENCRFDVAAVVFDERGKLRELTVYPDAFEFRR